MFYKITRLTIGFAVFLMLLSSVMAAEERAVQVGSENCYDSDGGKDYYQKGFIEEGTAETGIATNWDECEVDGTLNEFYCENGVAISSIYECFKGCSDGACSTCTTGLREQHMYCSSNNVWLPQKSDGKSCEVAFECSSNNCIQGTCKKLSSGYGMYVIGGLIFAILLIISLFFVMKRKGKQPTLEESA